MSIDFTRISTGDDFELLVRDIFNSQGAEIISDPAKGPDGGVDMIVRIQSFNPFGNVSYTTYVVQCKHYAKSGKAVGDVGDWRSICEANNVDGYFLVTSSMPTVNLAKNLKSAKGFSNLIWDKADLAKQIVNSPEYADIVSRHNLQDSIELLFDQAKMMLLGEYHLPFAHTDTLDDETYKGLIFIKTELDNEFNTIDKRIGYFCFLDLQNNHFVQTIKESYNLEKINIIDDSNSHADSINLNDLYSQLQGYRDNYYQNAIWTALSCCFQNPTAIRVIENSIRNMPYAPQNSTVENLKLIIESNPEKTDFILIAEAAKAVAKLNIQTAKKNLISQLNTADQWGLDSTKTSFLVQNLVAALIELDRDCKDCIDQVLDTFSAVVNAQVKAEIIQYFKALKIKDRGGIIMSFFDTYKGDMFPPRNHGISYGIRRVSIIEQSYLNDIDSLKKLYCDSIK